MILHIKNAPCTGLFVSSTYDQLKSNVLPAFRRILEQVGIPYTEELSRNIIKTNFGQILFRTGSNMISVQGFNAGWLCVDEVCYTPEEGYNMAVARVRDKKAKFPQIACASTPEFNYIYKLYVKNQSSKYKVYYAPTNLNSHVNAEYIENLRSQYSPELCKAYIEGQFVSLGGLTVYVNFDYTKHVNEEYTITTEFGHYNLMNPVNTYTLYCSLDWGRNPASSVVAQVSEHGGKKIIRIIDEIVLNDAQTHDVATEFVRRYGDKNYNLILTGDATGMTRRSTVSEHTDFEVMRQVCSGHFNNIQVNANKSNPLLGKPDSRINQLNSAFRGATNYQIIIHPKCTELIEDLQSVKYLKDDGGNGRRLDKSTGTHSSDALSYLILLLGSPLKTNLGMRSWS